jgi:hypothetical protein
VVGGKALSLACFRYADTSFASLGIGSRPSARIVRPAGLKLLSDGGSRKCLVILMFSVREYQFLLNSSVKV